MVSARGRGRRHLQNNANQTGTPEVLKNISTTIQPTFSPTTASPTPALPCAKTGERASACGADATDGSGASPIPQECCKDHTCMAGNLVCTLKIKAPLGGLKPGISPVIGGSLTQPGRPSTSVNGTSVNGTSVNGTESNTTKLPVIEKPLGETGLTMGLAFVLVTWAVFIGCAMQKLDWC